MTSPRTVTKIVQPSRSRPFLSRPRLIEFLHQQVNHKLILISAPAGYGKTTLLIDFAHETQLPVCWYSLGTSDADPRVFLEYLIAAVHRRFPEIGEHAHNVLVSGEAELDYRDVIGALITEIQDQMTVPFVIILDDYHAVGESEMINTLIQTLLTYLPEKAHLIIASRAMSTAFPLTQLTVRREMVSLGLDELQFTPEEIRAWALQDHQITLSAEDLAEIVARSEGWISGVILTTPILGQGQAHYLIQKLGTREQLFHFLATEAFARLEPELQRRLLDYSVFFRMDASICNELLETTDATDYLHEFENRNLFVVRLNDETGEVYYRFHNLYHEFLRQHLINTDPERWHSLNCRAAELFEKRELYMGQAIVHYLTAGSPAEAARIIELIGQFTYDEGRWSALAHWFDALPTEILEAHPHLMVMRGM
ncbi:partial Serine/threonine-protein kinase PknK, partial [Methylococcales bacterium]